MKITEEEKDRVFKAIIERQQHDTFVSLDWLDEQEECSSKRFANIINALVADRRIRIGGRRDYRWCVQDVPDKKAQILNCVINRPGWELHMDDMQAMTGLRTRDVAAICTQLFDEGHIVITDICIERPEEPEPEADDENGGAVEE